MELNTELLNTNVDLIEGKENQSISIWRGLDLVARVEFQDGKVFFVAKAGA